MRIRVTGEWSSCCPLTFMWSKAFRNQSLRQCKATRAACIWTKFDPRAKKSQRKNRGGTDEACPSPFIGVDLRPIHSTPRSVHSTAQQANNTAAEHHEQDIWRSLQTMIAAPYAAIQRRCIHIISCASSCVLYHTTCTCVRVWRSYTEEIHIIHCASSCVLFSVYSASPTCVAQLYRGDGREPAAMNIGERRLTTYPCIVEYYNLYIVYTTYPRRVEYCNLYILHSAHRL